MDIKISVVIPAYNCEKTIKKAIDSVLNQSFLPYEIIVINDCSTDGTLDVLKQYSSPIIRVFSNEKNLGVSKSRNRGWDYATGDYVAFLDSDDVWFKDKLLYQKKLLERYGAVLLSCENTYNPEYIDRINDKNEKIKKVSLTKNLFKNRFHTSNTIVKRDIPSRFRSNVMCEDYLLWCEIVSNSKKCFYSNVVTSYYYETKDKNGLSSNFKKNYIEGEKKILSILRKEHKIGIFRFVFSRLWFFLKYLIRKIFKRKVFANYEN